MVPKYTILKALIQNFSKGNKSERGFTLVELIVGLAILLIVGGLAMNAFVQASISFNKDKRSIDSNQNSSAILELIGNDIKESGENIYANNFPTIEFKLVSTTEPLLKLGSSKVIIRRAVTNPLTLCEDIAANADPAARINLVVADNTITGPNGRNCDVATATSPLSIYRVPPTTTVPIPSTTYYPTPIATALPTSPAPLALRLPLALRKLRDYRCQLDDINPSPPYDDRSRAGEDFCGGTAALERLRIAVSDTRGHILIFNQTNETVDAGNSADTLTTGVKKYGITVNTTFATGDPATANNTRNRTVSYPIGSSIYAIEERVYSLDANNNLQLSLNGATPVILVRKIESFKVSARTYNSTQNRTENPTPTIVPASDICTGAPTYICRFYYNSSATALAAPATSTIPEDPTDTPMDWKLIAGVKVEIQAKYDGTGQNATPTTADNEKLTATAEFFPRNVLSR
jgi:prepilin-type N-terminal cleavage/methylation domain-containing protein